MAAVLQRHPVRTTAYAVILVLLAAFYALRFAAFATTGEAAYGLALVLTAAFALVAGALALQQFLAVRRDAFLLVSAGLWIAAALHLYHFAAFAGVLGSAESTVATASALRGALLPTLFFSLFLCLSLLANRQDRPSAAQPGGVFLAAATLAFIVTVAALVFPLPQPASIVIALGQPLVPLTAQLDLLLAAALALVGIGASMRSGSWRIDPFSRWVLLSFVITLVALARFPLVYVWPSELLLLFGHAVVLVSYVCVAMGIIARATVTTPAAATAPAASRAAPGPSPLSRDVEDTPVRAPALALRELQASHRALRNATDGLLIGVRGDGTITDWKLAADFGPTAMPSDVLGKNIREVLPADQAEAIVAAVAQALQVGKTEELQYAAADGSVALGGYVAPHTDGQALCVMRDHTAHARALHELEELRSAAESLRRVTGDWLIRMTPTGTIQDLQPPAAELAAFGDMFAGKRLQDVFQGDDVTPLVAAAEAALASGEVQELSFLRQSGQVLAVRVANYAKDSALCLLRDTTELNEATAQLQESEETNQELRAHLERLTTEQSTALHIAESSVRVLQELLPDLVLRVRADGTILECRPGESFGPREVDGVVGAKVREVLPVDLASQMMAAIERVQNAGQPQRFTCHPVGGQVLAGGIAALVADQFLCVVRDQTQQKQMEMALAQQAAVLAQEMQVKLEEESLRALRTENDVLRAHLLRVAQLALEVGTGTAPADATSEAGSKPDARALEDSGETQDTAQPAETASGQAVPAPTHTQEEPATPPAAPTSPPTQAASDPDSSLPDKSREVDTLANGESVRHGAEAGTDGSPRNSAGSPAAETATQAKTAVATKAETRLKPTATDNGQQENNAMTNGEPTEEDRPA